MSTAATSSAHSAGDSEPGRRAVSPAFVTTHWSVVLTAGRTDTPRAEQALARLCETYWYPLYAFVRRRGYSAEDAQDLTQEFLSRLLARNWVGNANPAKGRFRTFLLTAMSRFLADQWDKSKAQKRGGDARIVSLQFDTGETRYGQEPVDPVTPEQCFERRWALTLLESVLDRLRAEYEQGGKGGLFATLRPCILGETEAESYAQLAGKLEMNEGAIKVAAHRLRRRYRELLREEVGHTVASAGEIEEELRHLLAVLAG